MTKKTEIGGMEKECKNRSIKKIRGRFDSGNVVTFIIKVVQKYTKQLQKQICVFEY